MLTTSCRWTRCPLTNCHCAQSSKHCSRRDFVPKIFFDVFRFFDRRRPTGVTGIENRPKLNRPFFFIKNHFFRFVSRGRELVSTNFLLWRRNATLCKQGDRAWDKLVPNDESCNFFFGAGRGGWRRCLRKNHVNRR